MCLINLKKELIKYPDYKIPIYRIIPFHRLIEILENKELTISQTESWEDCYENFFAKIQFDYGNFQISSVGFREMIYGNCWSLREETDALWRIYSHDKMSVKIQSSLLKLKKATEQYSNDDNNVNSWCIGKVKYKSLTSIKNSYSNISQKYLRNHYIKQIIKSQFIKRIEFQHEVELRLILASAQDRKLGFPRIRKIKIDPSDFIESVVFDPRLDSSIYQLHKKILEHYKFTDKISHSNLYRFDEWIFKRNMAHI